MWCGSRTPNKLVVLLEREDQSKSLLQALNDQNQAAIDERLATPDVRMWINNDLPPKNIQNPVKQFKTIN